MEVWPKVLVVLVTLLFSTTGPEPPLAEPPAALAPEPPRAATVAPAMPPEPPRAPADVPPLGPRGVPLQFGIDRHGTAFFEKRGMKPDLAAFWAGPWNERAGWDYLGEHAAGLADRGIAPVVQWYYWGGDISPGCVEQGCWTGALWKSRALWNADAAALADALHAGLQGRPGFVVLETEFNKNGIEAYEPFDGYLVEHAAIFRARAPELRLVLGFGNWEPSRWPAFDRAMAAMDLAGLQTMRAWTRDTSERYLGAADAVLEATRALHGTFGKPVLLHDLALSSYGVPDWEVEQERTVRGLFERGPQLAEAGLAGIVYRALDDNPTFPADEYYGEAERHMGLRTASGEWKPALDAWLAGLEALRAGA